MNLRVMTVHDLPEVFKISEEQFGAHSWQFEMFVEELCLLNHWAIVGEENGEIVCFLSFMLTDGARGLEYNILNIATKKGHEKKGYGTQLLTFLSDNAKQNGYNSIWLEVRESNQKAIDFYQNFGFKFDYLRKKYYSDGENALILSYFIKNA